MNQAVEEPRVCRMVRDTFAPDRMPTPEECAQAVEYMAEAVERHDCFPSKTVEQCVVATLAWFYRVDVQSWGEAFKCAREDFNHEA